MSDPLTMKVVIGFGDYLILWFKKKAIEKLPFWILTYFSVSILSDFCSDEMISGLHCAIL